MEEKILYIMVAMFGVIIIIGIITLYYIVTIEIKARYYLAIKKRMQELEK
jgi:hypothetical protein